MGTATWTLLATNWPPLSGQWVEIVTLIRFMQLTESEKKALEQAKKIEARWPKMRWMVLAFGFVWSLIGYIDIAYRPIIPWAGSVLLGMGIAQWILLPKMWNGRPTLKLLIKFSETNQENSN